MRVENTLTRLTPSEAVEALAAAFRDVTGVRPTPRSLAILVAQTALETGQWKKMHNFNFGNIRGTFEGRWTSFRASEIVDGKEVFLDPGEDNKFRAYPDAAAGARDFIRFLAVDTNGDGSNRYERAWQAVLDGFPRGFVACLARAGYFTASERLYYDGLRALYDQFLPLCQESLETRTEPPESGPPEDRIAELERRVSDLEQTVERMRLHIAGGHREMAERLGA